MKKFFYIFILLVSLIFVSCGPGVADFQVNINDKYRLSESSADYIVIDRKKNNSSEREMVIPKKVTELAYDKEYLIAKQLEFEDKKLNDSNFKVQYWIIDFKNDKVYKFLTEEEFEKGKRDFKIDKNLKLKKIDKFR